MVDLTGENLARTILQDLVKLDLGVVNLPRTSFWWVLQHEWNIQRCTSSYFPTFLAVVKTWAETSTTFKTSCKRQAQLVSFQVFFEGKTRKILKPSQTRRLSLLVVVKRVIELWEPLCLYFTSEWVEHRLNAAENILRSLNDKNQNMFNYYFLFWNGFCLSFILWMQIFRVNMFWLPHYSLHEKM